MINSLELFSGVGGLAMGLHQAGFLPSALLDRDKDSCDNILSNIACGFHDVKDWNVVMTDVRSVDYDSYKGIQFITGGPPCQPFSLGGKHKANTDARDMFPEAVRAVREVRPLGFIFENVKGLLRKSFSTYFDYILLQLNYPEITAKTENDWLAHLRVLEQHHTSRVRTGLEYNVVFRLVNAADYGVPQIRHRVVIVGFRTDLNVGWSFPEPTHSKESLLYSQFIDGTYWDEHKIAAKNRPEIAARFYSSSRQAGDAYCKTRWQTVRDALCGLPDPKSIAAANHYNHEFKGGARQYAGHSGSILDEPSKTIKAGSHGVPGGENMFADDSGALRYYTVRESARMQTFPDNYMFCGSWTESMRQIGNAVPVRLARIVGESIAVQMKKVSI